MKRNCTIPGLILVLFLAGCVSPRQQSAMVNNGIIHNPSLGLFGFSFEIPEGIELYNPATQSSEQFGEIQQLAIRIYNLNRDYHPRGAETFYDSFLMFSERTAVLLMMLEVDEMFLSHIDFSFDDTMSSVDQVPLYNIQERRIVSLGEHQTDAVCCRGYAYEYRGWYYAREKRKRNFFLYESCKVAGGNRDHYVLMGFCQPGDEETLALQMEEMRNALRF